MTDWWATAIQIYTHTYKLNAHISMISISNKSNSNIQAKYVEKDTQTWCKLNPPANRIIFESCIEFFTEANPCTLSVRPMPYRDMPCCFSSACLHLYSLLTKCKCNFRVEINLWKISVEFPWNIHGWWWCAFILWCFSMNKMWFPHRMQLSFVMARSRFRLTIDSS